jgi:DNA repair protein RadD
MNKELVTRKSILLLELEQAKHERRNRAILDLASRAAALEGKIAHDLIISNRSDDAIVNLISQASCFHDAKRFIEKERVLRFAAELAVGKRVAGWINDELERMENGNPNPSSVFFDTPVFISENSKLRRPQAEAYAAAKDWFSKGNNRHAIIQLPVGCGKTGAIAILPFGIARGRMLVVAPSLIIRDNLYKNLDITNQSSFLRRFGVLAAGRRPACAVLDEKANIRDCDAAAIVVTNIQQLVSGSREKWLYKLSPDFFDMIVMDEAHHSPAATWKESLEYFPSAKIASFTATPFRADGQKVDGTRIYQFPVSQAIIEGYVKDIASHRIEPEEIRFVYKGESITHTLQEVIRLKEKDWFSKGVALSPECNRGIVDHSITCVRQLRTEGTEKHAIIAVACSIDHARAIRAMYEERNLDAEVIHSDLQSEEQDRILKRLEHGELDVIVQVQMLGEGADFPSLSVAAIFRPFRNLVPYVQFVGRIMRVMKQDRPGDVDNRGYVVSHVGLNVDRWWEELKELDEGDQDFFEALANSERDFLFERVPSAEPRPRRRFMPSMVVLEETIAHYVSDRFLPEEVSAVTDDVINAIQLRGLDLQMLGITREQLESKVQGAMTDPARRGAVIEQPVQPQKARQMARRRLDERVKSASKELLNELKLNFMGFDLPRQFPNTHTVNNLSAAMVLLNLQVQEYLGLGPNERDVATAEQLINAHNAMDELIDAVAEKFRARKRKGDAKT